MTNPHFDLVRRYLSTLERFESVEQLAAFYDPDVVVTEMPNRLNPKGLERRRHELLAAAAAMGQAVTSQRYDVKSMMGEGDTVVAEIDWAATIAKAFGSTPAGGTMRAHLAMFVTVREGRIVRQRNYDCYLPF